MSDPQGLKSAHLETTGTLVTGSYYLKGLIFLSGGTAGDIILRDGGASGTIVCQFNVPANTNNSVDATIPGAGILFETDMHVTLPASAKITVFYGK
jgi:hypothetical protein